MKFMIMAVVHILIFGEMAGFKLVPYIATHMKKVLKYVISKYAIWKNIAYFDPKQFLLFPQCFQKLSVVDASKWVSME